MVAKLVENPSVRLLKHVVRCYLRLSEHLRARDALKHTLPDALKDQTFAPVLRTEESVQRWLMMLLKNLSGQESAPSGGAASQSGVVNGVLQDVQPSWKQSYGPSSDGPPVN